MVSQSNTAKLWWFIVVSFFLVNCSSSLTITPDRQSGVGRTATPITAQAVPLATSQPEPTAMPPIQPYPYTTPLPPPTPTILDGLYIREVPFMGTPTPCRRCAPYRAEGGAWLLRFDAGVFRVSHSTSNFQGIGSFTISGNQLNLFNDPNCHTDVSRYAWQVEADQLVLSTAEDDCAFGLRLKNFSGGPWRKYSDDPQAQFEPCQPPNTEAAVSGHWSPPPSCQHIRFTRDDVP